MIREHLYDEYGVENNLGHSLGEQVTKVIDKLLKDNPNFNLIDIEHMIISYTTYACSIERLKDGFARAKYRRTHDNSTQTIK